MGKGSVWGAVPFLHPLPLTTNSASFLDLRSVAFGESTFWSVVPSDILSINQILTLLGRTPWPTLLDPQVQHHYLTALTTHSPPIIESPDSQKQGSKGMSRGQGFIRDRENDRITVHHAPYLRVRPRLTFLSVTVNSGFARHASSCYGMG